MIFAPQNYASFGFVTTVGTILSIFGHLPSNSNNKFIFHDIVKNRTVSQYGINISVILTST